MCYFNQIWLAVICVKFLMIIGVMAEKNCFVSLNKTSCSGINLLEYSENEPLEIRNEDVKYLELSNQPLKTINADLFNKFSNLESLYLSNCKIEELGRETFRNLKKLRKLDLSDNLIQNLSTNNFPDSLEVLILKQNLIQHFDYFNISNFPNLKMLDLSDNRIKYLPGALLQKNITIIASNNPWNCDYELAVANIFCGNADFNIPNCNFSSNHKTSKSVDNDTVSGCLLTCLYSTLASLWVGIILGNIYKIKNLLCPQPKVTFDRTTQYEKNDVMPLQVLQEKRAMSKVKSEQA